MRRGANSPVPASRRLDQWLWFARFVKTRSRASRLCATGAVVVNGAAISKVNHHIRLGDVVAVPQGAFLRTIRVLSCGARRGPATEARFLYEEILAPVRLSELAPAWAPLLVDDDPSNRDERFGPEVGRSEIASGYGRAIRVKSKAR